MLCKHMTRGTPRAIPAIGMKWITLLLICSVSIAQPSREEFDAALREYNTPVKAELPQCPPPLVIKQESALPDWAWFALGGLAGVAGVSFFYYNRRP